MPYHSYRLLIDWSGNGQFNINATSDENVSADIISGIRARAGIDYSQIFPQAVAGRASFTLRNDHRRYSGYNDGNTLGSGLLRGVLLQVWCASNTAFGGTGAWLPIWGGVVDYVQYGTSPSGLDTAEIHCVGNLASMQDARVELSIGSSSSIASIGTDIATAVWPSTRVQDTGNATFRYIMASGNPRHRYYLETSNSPTITGYIYSGRALAGLRSLAQDTGSRLYEGPDGAVRLYSTAAQSRLSGGAARFTLRHTSTGTSASTYHITSASPEIAQRDVINRVAVSWTTSSSQTYTTTYPYGNRVYLIDQTPWAVSGGERRPSGEVQPGQSRFLPQEVTPGDSIAGTLHNAGQTDAYMEWTTSVSLPTFERGDPDPTARLQAVSRFHIASLILSQIPYDGPFIETRQQSAWTTIATSALTYSGRPRFLVFALASSRDISPDTELTIPSTDNSLNRSHHPDYFNAARYTASRRPNTMPVKILISQSTLHEYTIRVRLENLHQDLVTDPVPQLQALEIYVNRWSVETPPTETTHTYSDTTSISQWGVQSYDARVHWITTETQAQTYAQQVLDARAQPVTRYRVAYLLDQKARLTDIPQVSDIVDLEYRGTTTKCWVDSARHDISRRRHLCELLLTPV